MSEPVRPVVGEWWQWRTPETQRWAGRVWVLGVGDESVWIRWEHGEEGVQSLAFDWRPASPPSVTVTVELPQDELESIAATSAEVWRGDPNDVGGPSNRAYARFAKACRDKKANDDGS